MSAETLRQAAEKLRDGGANRLTPGVGLALADVIDAHAEHLGWAEGDWPEMDALVALIVGTDPDPTDAERGPLERGWAANRREDLANPAKAERWDS